MPQNLHQQTLQMRATSSNGVVYNEAWFEIMFVALDRLHDAVSQPADRDFPVAPADMVGWLEDIIYTAREAIVEIRENPPEETVTEVIGQEARSSDEVMF